VILGAILPCICHDDVTIINFLNGVGFGNGFTSQCDFLLDEILDTLYQFFLCLK
jgi:hypothetical protein